MGNSTASCSGERKEKSIDELKRDFLVQLLTLRNATEIPCRMIKNFYAWSWLQNTTIAFSQSQFIAYEKNSRIAGSFAVQAAFNATVNLMGEEYVPKYETLTVPVDTIDTSKVGFVWDPKYDSMADKACHVAIEDQDKIYEAADSLVKKISFPAVDLDSKRINNACAKLLVFSETNFVELVKTCPRGLGNYLRNTWQLVGIAEQIERLESPNSTSCSMSSLQKEFFSLITKLDAAPGRLAGCYTKLFVLDSQEEKKSILWQPSQIILQRLLDFDNFVVGMKVNPAVEPTATCKVIKPCDVDISIEHKE